MLRSIVEYCDSLINEYKRVQSKSTDKIVKELLQAKLNTIYEGLSVYCKTTESNHWIHCAEYSHTTWDSPFLPLQKQAVSSANVVQTEVSSVHKESLKVPTDKPAVKNRNNRLLHPLEASSPLITEQERSSTGSSNSSMSSSKEEMYIHSPRLYTGPTNPYR